MLKLYNTLTRKKEIFKPIKKGEVGIYTCGPTVYDYAHIGNMRTYIFSDILQKYLAYKGFKVTQVLNITDVGHLTSDADTGEDKMEKGAKREGKSAWEIAEFYTDAFLKDLERLNIKKPDVMPKATDHIQEQIDFIKGLEEKGFTYVISDGVYFDTSKLPDYGKLAKLNIENLKAGARIEMVEGKKNITDFALWKFTPKGEKRQMEWDSPWGKGFPGWHIECSAMSIKYLGKLFDIHTGAIDHIPVHHTNEIAQSEALLGEPFVRYWMHAEFLLIKDTRMGKSEGNLIKISDLVEEGFDPLAYRLLTYTASYRDKLNFTKESIQSAQKTYDNLKNFLLRVLEIENEHSKVDIQAEIGILRKEFQKNLDDDLNMPKALASIFVFISKINKLMDENKLSKEDGQKIFGLFLDLDAILSLNLTGIEIEELPNEIQNLIDQREEARKNKDFKKADQLRTEILERGYEVKDTPSGARWKKVK